VNKDSIRYVYFGIWAALMAANLYILFATKNAKAKRMLLPVLGVLAGVSVLLFLVLNDFSRAVLYLAVPVVILISILNLRQFKICDSCASLVRGEFFGVPKECHNCGARLNGK
jgi:hypothetical protein